jgi:hypothetical protein
LHSLSAAFVLGYHGCDQAVAERVVGGEDFKPSSNAYDWLGHGIYFWEANPRRGLEFAEELVAKRRGRVASPTVVGAIIDLGLCLDLTTSAGIAQVREAHRRLIEIRETADLPVPRNKADRLRRNLDCAVIEMFHDIRQKAGEAAVDCVKGVFIEGAPIYDTAGFHDKTHIQICVRNPDCIKGVFRVATRFLA